MRNTYSPALYILTLLPMFLMLGAVMLSVGVGESVTVFFRSYRYQNPDFTYWIKLMTDWGNPFLYLVYAVLYLRNVKNAPLHVVQRRRNFVLAWFIAQLLVSFLLVRICKIAIGRPRPDAEGLYMPFVFNSGNHAMPSGHTTEIVGSSLPLACMTSRRWGPALAALLGNYAALMGFSRIYLGQHHISDVFFGTLMGMFSALLMHTIWNQLNRKNHDG